MYESKTGGIGFIAGRWPLEPDLPTIVFIHGSGGASVLWRAQVEALAGDMNTIALDLPGHGASGGEGKNCIADYTAIVDGFITSLGVTRPVVCGLSIGGAIVLQLLLDMPQRYKAGIVVNSGARLRVMPLIFETIENDYRAYLEGAPKFSISEKTDPSCIAPLMEATATCPPEVTLGDFRACDAFDVMERLDEIGAPVLVLTASDDRMTPVKYGTFMANRIENATLVEIADAGHLSPMEKPQEVSRAITEFVSTL
ncbi:MAG: alpha/beta hydrolase [Actinobacteria bacterium]|jgi:pimeloyl-ACP methyl ester carboxylesterase|nr:MAG: alpha/beta hydrolase [Actinomycetota bacterium]